jgi:hypothetical protein
LHRQDNAGSLASTFLEQADQPILFPGFGRFVKMNQLRRVKLSLDLAMSVARLNLQRLMASIAVRLISELPRTKIHSSLAHCCSETFSLASSQAAAIGSNASSFVASADMMLDSSRLSPK